MTAKKPASQESKGTTEGAPKHERESRKSAATSAVRAIEERQKEDCATVPDPNIEASSFDSLVASELIEACRSHLASLTELADVTVRALRECYEYEDDDPHIWQCCDLVRQILTQAHAALIPLGVVSCETDLLTRAAEIAKDSEDQRRLLGPAVHVIRASIYILQRVEPNYHDQVLPALHDLESGTSMIIDGLERSIEGCPMLKQRVTAR